MKKIMGFLLLGCLLLSSSSFAEKGPTSIRIGMSYDDFLPFVEVYNMTQEEDEDGIHFTGTARNPIREMHVDIRKNEVDELTVFTKGKEHATLNNPLHPDWSIPLQDMIAKLEKDHMQYYCFQRGGTNIWGVLSPTETNLSFSCWVEKLSAHFDYFYTDEQLNEVMCSFQSESPVYYRRMISLFQREFGEPQKSKKYYNDDVSTQEDITWEIDGYRYIVSIGSNCRYETLDSIDVNSIFSVEMTIKQIKQGLFGLFR